MLVFVTQSLFKSQAEQIRVQRRTGVRTRVLIPLLGVRGRVRHGIRHRVCGVHRLLVCVRSRIIGSVTSLAARTDQNEQESYGHPHRAQATQFQEFIWLLKYEHQARKRCAFHSSIKYRQLLDTLTTRRVRLWKSKRSSRPNTRKGSDI